MSLRATPGCAAVSLDGDLRDGADDRSSRKGVAGPHFTSLWGSSEIGGVRSDRSRVDALAQRIPACAGPPSVDLDRLGDRPPVPARVGGDDDDPEPEPLRLPDQAAVRLEPHAARADAQPELRAGEHEVVARRAAQRGGECGGRQRLCGHGTEPAVQEQRRRRQLGGAAGASEDPVAAELELSAPALDLACSLDRTEPARSRSGARRHRAGRADAHRRRRRLV